jgi:hypothetical protein
VRAIATVPDHLPAPDPEMPDDLARDWPDVADAELADREPADPGLPEAGGREVLKAGRRDRAHGEGGGFAAGGVPDAAPPGPVLAGSPRTPGPLG